MKVEVGPSRRNAGAGDCATYRAAWVDATFEASDEPWLLVSGNRHDEVTFVREGESSASWESRDFTDCFGLEQINFLGDVFTTDHKFCIPYPPRDGGLDASNTEADADVEPSDSDNFDSDNSDSDNSDSGNSDSDEPEPSDASTEHKPSAEPDKVRAKANPRSPGCSVSRNEGTSAAAWFVAILLGLVSRRKR